MDARPTVIELRTLGTLDARQRGGAALQSILAQPKRTALLMYLALARPRGLHQRDTLLALFWGDRDTERARKALRQALYFLKASLGDRALVTIGDSEVGISSEHVWCDAVEMERAIGEHRFEDAVALYAGELLPGFNIDDAPEFERWLDQERGWLRSRAAEAAWKLALEREAAGDAAATIQWARHAASLSPVDETVVRRLMELLDRVGDRAAALRAFDEFSELFRREYEMEPSPETVAQADALRQQTVLTFDPAVTLAANEKCRLQSGPDRFGAEDVAARADKGVRQPIHSNKRRAKAVALISIFGRRRVALTALAAIGVVIVGVVMGGAALRAKYEYDDRRVVVFPLSTRTTPQSEYLGRAMADYFQGSVSSLVPTVRVVSPDSVFDAIDRLHATSATDQDIITNIARLFGAGRWVTGNVVQIQDSLQVTFEMFHYSRPHTPRSVVNGKLSPHDLDGHVHYAVRAMFRSEIARSDSLRALILK